MKRNILTFLFALISIASTWACEISLSTNDKKLTYKVGDEVLINVQVKQIHHHCELGIKDTKFSYAGLKIVSATEWKEVSPGVYTRQVKALVVDTANHESKFTVKRTCDREGGLNAITLKQAS